MISKFKLSGLAIAFACLLLPQVGIAQDGTLEDCLNAFDTNLGTADGAVEAANRAGRCDVNAGKAFTQASGDWVTDNTWRVVYNVNLDRDGKEKRCAFRIHRLKQGEAAVELHRSTFILPGKDAAAWNKCLKGDCCLDMLALFDN